MKDSPISFILREQGNEFLGTGGERLNNLGEQVSLFQGNGGTRAVFPREQGHSLGEKLSFRRTSRPVLILNVPPM